ncbi:uncharacterized protein SCHCODRAFT_02710304, partial [Schizophyllum commune H4-8]|uniref:uncharacterized protein n=1 Tax=Schizophyllum commune (strain H4-8 / FGSC 9210) TaxID=578458 RepID=UPI00215EBF5A
RLRTTRGFTSAFTQASWSQRRCTLCHELRATPRDERKSARTSPTDATCAASLGRTSKSRRILRALWLTFSQGYGGRLNERSARTSPNLPTCRWAGLGRGPPRSDPEICDAGLEVWAATGRGVGPFAMYKEWAV